MKNGEKLNNPFIFKSVRADERNFWDEFIQGLIDGERTALRMGPRKRYTLRLSNVWGKPRKYEVVDNHNKWSLFGWFGKWGKTQHQSVSYCDPDKDYYPPVFGHARIGIGGDVLVGVRLDPKDVGIQRIMTYDGGTIDRGYDSEGLEEAQRKLEHMLNKDSKWHTTENFLTEYVTKQKMYKHHNEFMARLRWNTDGSSGVVIFTDNPESRCLAQLRALDLQVALRRKYFFTYKVPISFYTPDARDKKLRLYDEKDYATDLECRGFGHYKALIEIINNQTDIKNYLADDLTDDSKKQPTPDLYNIAKLTLNCSVALRQLFFDKLLAASNLSKKDILKNIRFHDNNPRHYGRLLRVLLKDGDEIEQSHLSGLLLRSEPSYKPITGVMSHPQTANILLILRYLDKNQYKKFIGAVHSSDVLWPMLKEGDNPQAQELCAHMLNILTFEQRIHFIEAIKEKFQSWKIHPVLTTKALEHHSGKNISIVNIFSYLKENYAINLKPYALTILTSISVFAISISWYLYYTNPVFAAKLVVLGYSIIAGANFIFNNLIYAGKLTLFKLGVTIALPEILYAVITIGFVIAGIKLLRHCCYHTERSRLSQYVINFVSAIPLLAYIVKNMSFCFAHAVYTIDKALDWVFIKPIVLVDLYIANLLAKPTINKLVSNFVGGFSLIATGFGLYNYLSVPSFALQVNTLITAFKTTSILFMGSIIQDLAYAGNFVLVSIGIAGTSVAVEIGLAIALVLISAKIINYTVDKLTATKFGRELLVQENIISPIVQPAVKVIATTSNGIDVCLEYGIKKPCVYAYRSIRNCTSVTSDGDKHKFSHH